MRTHAGDFSARAWMCVDRGGVLWGLAQFFHADNCLGKEVGGESTGFDTRGLSS